MNHLPNDCTRSWNSTLIEGSHCPLDAASAGGRRASKVPSTTGRTVHLSLQPRLCLILPRIRREDQEGGEDLHAAEPHEAGEEDLAVRVQAVVPVGGQGAEVGADVAERRQA